LKIDQERAAAEVVAELVHVPEVAAALGQGRVPVAGVVEAVAEATADLAPGPSQPLLVLDPVLQRAKVVLGHILGPGHAPNLHDQRKAGRLLQPTTKGQSQKRKRKMIEHCEHLKLIVYSAGWESIIRAS